MQSVEDFLQAHASFPPDTIKTAPVAEFLRERDVEPLATGLQTRVFRIKNQPWVVKEGRWDLEVPITSHATLSLHAGLMESVLKHFSFTFLPTEEEILKSHGHYLQSLPYLGCFMEDPPRYPGIEKTVEAQRALRDRLAGELPMIERVFGMTFPDRMKRILRSESRYHNFLLKEYLLIGQPYSPEGRRGDRQTFFVFQEYAPGKTLHDIDMHAADLPGRDQFALLLYLLLVLRHETGLVPDTRPRYMVAQAHRWLTKTDNIMLTDHGLKFIDTRWFWQTEGNLIERGLFIPDWTIAQAKKELKGLWEE